MSDFFHGPLGAIHTLSATVALIFGMMVLLKKKGTTTHRILGYIYFVSMLALNITAIPITNMTGSIGLFHVFVAISLPTILIAIYFPLFGRTHSNWMLRHFEFMYWSYVGLIAAFIAEVLVRLPWLLSTDRSVSNQDVEADIGIISAILIMIIVMGLAEYIFRAYRKRLLS